MVSVFENVAIIFNILWIVDESYSRMLHDEFVIVQNASDHTYQLATLWIEIWIETLVYTHESQ